MPNLADLRENYTRGTLDTADALPDPMGLFQHWFDQAVEGQLPEPNAMHLATVGTDGRPSGRIVLLKGLDDGFLFFTNYHSRKGHELARNDHAALTFFWVELQRQVRVEGCVEKVSEADSDAYFASRPRGSQLGAWVSAQSEPIPDRAFLEKRNEELEATFAGVSVPRPAHWGGYRLRPDYVEFWQGRPSRLHDRIAYTKLADGGWKIERLSP